MPVTVRVLPVCSGSAPPPTDGVPGNSMSLMQKHFWGRAGRFPFDLPHHQMVEMATAGSTLIKRAVELLHGFFCPKFFKLCEWQLQRGWVLPYCLSSCWGVDEFSLVLVWNNWCFITCGEYCASFITWDWPFGGGLAFGCHQSPSPDTTLWMKFGIKTLLPCKFAF